MNGTVPLIDSPAGAPGLQTRPCVSVIICTRNRADSLRETLVSLARCIVPPELAVELFVIDNGSTDATPQVVSQARLENMPVRLVHEPTPGLSHARNAALRATTADVLLFTDDDARLPPGWIEGMCRPILAGEADAVAGGVHFPASYEEKLSREPFRSRRGWLASTEAIDPHKPGGFVGANMAMSRRVVEILGEFDPCLGAGALGFCEESLYGYRLLAAGLRIKAALGISVEHHFDLTRLTRRTLLNMAERMGQSTAYVAYHWDHDVTAGAHSNRRRAAIMLFLERLKTPWRGLTQVITSQEAQRVQTLAYWRKLTELSGQPRHYHRAQNPTS